ncbi:MAG: YHS domain-containing protein, partial [Gemmatimonadales bacterium]
MTVDPAHAAAEVEHAGTRYFFCSTGCAAKFRAEPERYIANRAADPGEPRTAGPGSALRGPKP